MDMSEIIKAYRTKLGLTQEELGEKLGLQKSAVAKYESGRVENIKRSTIMKMAALFGCSPSELFGWTPEYSQNDLKLIEKSEAKDIELLNAYRSASEETQSIIRRILGI